MASGVFGKRCRFFSLVVRVGNLVCGHERVAHLGGEIIERAGRVGDEDGGIFGISADVLECVEILGHQH